MRRATGLKNVLAWRTAVVLSLTIAAGFAGSAWAAGDSVRVSVPATVNAGVPYAITISGSASRPERLYLFVDYHKCGATPAVEHQRANGNFWTVHGTFTQRSGGWHSTLKANDHACVYLAKLTAPLNSGTGVVAHAFLAYRIH